jgi:Flp pilus assembly protein TadB
MTEISFKFDSKNAASWFQAFLLIAGLLLFVYGAYLIWHPLGFLIGGAVVFAIGLLMNKISEAQNRQQ